MNAKLLLVAALGLTLLIPAGCTNNPQTNNELACAGGVLGGGAVGGLLGNQLGSGKGKQAMTAVGAGAGAAAGTQTGACRSL